MRKLICKLFGHVTRKSGIHFEKIAEEYQWIRTWVDLDRCERCGEKII